MTEKVFQGLSEVAKHSGMTLQNLKYHSQAGHIRPDYVQGKTYYFKSSTVEAFLAAWSRKHRLLLVKRNALDMLTQGSQDLDDKVARVGNR